MKHELEFSPATMVITGADRGLGFQLVKQSLERGHRVFAGKFRSKWNLLEELQKEYPDRLDIVELDVTSDESVSKACEHIRNQCKWVDILINNAGIMASTPWLTPFDQLEYDKMMLEINVNAFGALRMMSGLLPWICKSHYRMICNISSEAGSIGANWRSDGVGYGISKAALNKAAAIVAHAAGEKHSVRVVNLHPGSMQTVLFQPDRKEQQTGADADYVEFQEQDMTDAEEAFGFYTPPAYNAELILNLLSDPTRITTLENAKYLSFMGDPMPW